MIEPGNQSRESALNEHSGNILRPLH
jgi:hypothetical protein